MKPSIYANIEQLSYGELLSALTKIKENEKNFVDYSDTTSKNNISYKDALIMELDKRQREI